MLATQSDCDIDPVCAVFRFVLVFMHIVRTHPHPVQRFNFEEISWCAFWQEFSTRLSFVVIQFETVVAAIILVASKFELKICTCLKALSWNVTDE